MLGNLLLLGMVPTTSWCCCAGKHQKYTSWPHHQLLLGHTGRVNCLLYPHSESTRYDPAHIVSGGGVLFTLSLPSVLRIRIRDPGSDAFLTPGPGIRNRFFPDPGSQTHIFESLVTIFWVISSIILGKLANNFFLQSSKTKIICNFVKFVAA